ncbi:MAG: adenylate/guanylate cyclase domain-containing protein [Burkholderiales bacterium]|nr:adenylate/guanylate cyclase domain-containing protein [Burkholderiales bacterium]
MKRHLARILLGLGIALFFAGHAAHLYRVGFIERLDAIIYDARLRLTMPGTGDPRIVILDIDERSLAEFGRWPWSRDRLAALLDALFDRYGVALVAFDVVWAERDTSSGLPVLEALARGELREAGGFVRALERLRGELDYDRRFAAAIRGRPVVLGYYLSSEEHAERKNALPPPVLPTGAFAGRPIAFTVWRGYTGNLPEYTASAAGAGHINPIVDPDGVVRRVPMLAELDGAYYEPLSLAIVRTLLARGNPHAGAPPVEPGFAGDAADYGGLEWLKVGPLVVPVDENAAALVPYHGARGSFRYISLGDVLAGRLEPDALRGKVAIVGTSAPGLLDLRATPVENVYPGVEIHANLVAGMLNGRMKSRPGWVLGAEVILIVLVGAAFALLIPALSALWASAAAAGSAALLAGLNVLAWRDADLALPLAALLLMIVCVYTMNMAYGYFVESRTKRRVAEVFGQYVPPEVVDRIVADPERYSMEPRTAELTILFSDVRGFTSISEALSPEALRDYINEYLTDMSTIIRERHGGTLDKYIGDAIMAFWGAPLADPEHARHGVLAALAMQRHCAVLNERFRARGWPALKIGVGLNSGLVRVGDMGSRVRRAYTAMGDAVNVASRLEGRTKYYGAGILVGEATRAAAPGILFREVDRVRVKGKDEALTIYEPLGEVSEVAANTVAECDAWHAALAAYRARAWDDAERALARLIAANPSCTLYRLYVERVGALRASPPPADWDAVTSFEEK